MGFLHKFIQGTFGEGHHQAAHSSFAVLTDDQLESHLKIARYGEFVLTDAVRPSYDLHVVPRAGYRHDMYRDEETGIEIPVLMAAASRERVLELFVDLLDPLGPQLDVVLESSHHRDDGEHDDLFRESIDAPVLKSILYDFEDLLLDDGCTGLAVLNTQIPLEVQFDEHKLLIVYGRRQGEFEPILARHGVPRSEEIRFITEAEHVHSSSDEFTRRVEELKYRIGIEE